jgi:hypothetical protein
MVIKDVVVTHEKDSTTISATCKLRKIGWDKIYIKLTGEKHAEYVADDASPFAAALLLPSMKQGEDLIIQGAISRKLYEGMKKIQPVVIPWNIGFKPIEIKADKLVKDSGKPNHTASFFSGGVDSFYTYLKHKTDKKEQDRIDTFILVRGFDIDPRNEELWGITLKNIKAIARKEKIELLIVENNIRGILEPILPRGDYSHGGCLAAIGLFLRNGFSKIYIPSTFSVAEQLPWGSHMDVDGHWSTEQTTFIHDGTECTRLGKIMTQVSKSPVAMQYLRVCYMNTKSEYNCGHCDKCLRTMTGLYVAEALDKTKTFPHTLDYEAIAEGPHVVGDGVYIAHGEIEVLKTLKQKNMDPKLQEALETKLEKAKHIRTGFIGHLKFELAKLYLEVIYLDFAYTYSALYGTLSGAFGKKFS